MPKYKRIVEENHDLSPISNPEQAIREGFVLFPHRGAGCRDIWNPYFEAMYDGGKPTMYGLVRGEHPEYPELSFVRACFDHCTTSTIDFESYQRICAELEAQTPGFKIEIPDPDSHQWRFNEICGFVQEPLLLESLRNLSTILPPLIATIPVATSEA